MNRQNMATRDFTARRCASKVYAVALCLSFCLSVTQVRSSTETDKRTGSSKHCHAVAMVPFLSSKQVEIEPLTHTHTHTHTLVDL